MNTEAKACQYHAQPNQSSRKALREQKSGSVKCGILSERSQSFEITTICVWLEVFCLCFAFVEGGFPSMSDLVSLVCCWHSSLE